MPDLDISELFTDTDLAGMCISIIRTVRSVSQGGTTIETSNPLTAVGLIYPSSAQELSVLSDEDRVGAFISVVSTFRFVPLTTSNSPDIVVWENANYRVMNTTDYRQYGVGMVVAVCQMIPFALDDSVL